MKKITAFVAMLFLIAESVFSQQIEIGQDANEIKEIIMNSTDEHDNADMYGNISDSYWSWDVIDSGNQIDEVIQCYSNQFLPGLSTVANYCKHFIMHDGVLAYMITQFDDISVEDLNKYYFFNYIKYKRGDMYFSKDYSHYITINIAENGNANIIWKKTELSDIPEKYKDEIELKLNTQEDVTIDDDSSKNKIEEELKSKTYDLKVHDSSAYNLFINNLRDNLLEELKSDTLLPDWDELENDDKKFVTFKNKYTALYKIVDYGLESDDDKFLLNASVYDVRSENHFKLLSGDDTACYLLRASPLLPTIKINGFEVMTDAKVDSIDVACTKGITNVKINHGKIIFKNFPPPLELQQSITEKINDLKNGTYQIKYETGQVMGDPFMDIKKKKLNSVGGNIWRTTVVLIALTFLAIVSVE